MIVTILQLLHEVRIPTAFSLGPLFRESGYPFTKSTPMVLIKGTRDPSPCQSWLDQPWIHDSVSANHILPPQDLLAVGVGLRDDVFERRRLLRVPFWSSHGWGEHAEAEKPHQRGEKKVAGGTEQQRWVTGAKGRLRSMTSTPLWGLGSHQILSCPSISFLWFK